MTKNKPSAGVTTCTLNWIGTKQTSRMAAEVDQQFEQTCIRRVQGIICEPEILIAGQSSRGRAPGGAAHSSKKEMRSQLRAITRAHSDVCCNTQLQVIPPSAGGSCAKQKL